MFRTYPSGPDETLVAAVVSERAEKADQPLGVDGSSPVLEAASEPPEPASVEPGVPLSGVGGLVVTGLGSEAGL
jgi:hypothetical protein